MIPRFSERPTHIGKTLRRLTILVALLGAFSAVSLAQEYTVGAKDVLEIKVFGEPDLDRSVEVASDGTITFPLVGSVKAGGLTVRQIEGALEQMLGKDYLVNPDVTVQIKEYRSQKVFVLGAVKEPGFYELRGPTTVLEILSSAGGLSQEGGKTLVLVREAGFGEAASDLSSGSLSDLDELPSSLGKKGHTQIIDYYRMVNEGDASQNVVLNAGDVLFVPRAQEIFVLGEVKKPGSVKFESDITLLRAISLAGGLTEVAADRRVQVIRIKDGQKENLTVNLKQIIDDIKKDIKLLPDDVIVVPKRIL